MLEGLLTELRALLSKNHSRLVGLFDAFSDEARFGRRWLSACLSGMPREARILEVGGGLMLLSAALQREGFEVTAVEPIGSGFSALSELQAIVLDHVATRGWAPRILRQCVEELSAKAEYDFAFSVNVMEHVADVDQTIEQVVAALKPFSIYRFTCPNYLFPYEPHFDIPTLLSKRLTHALMKNRIYGSERVLDPEGMWASLNWITVPQIRRAAGALPSARVEFHREILIKTFERVIAEPQFGARRSPWIRGLVALAVSRGLHRVLAKLPPSVLPIIDCSVLKGRA